MLNLLFSFHVALFTVIFVIIYLLYYAHSLKNFLLVIVVPLDGLGGQGHGAVRVVYQVGLHVRDLVVPHLEVLHGT